MIKYRVQVKTKSSRFWFELTSDKSLLSVWRECDMYFNSAAYEANDAGLRASIRVAKIKQELKQ